MAVMTCAEARETLWPIRRPQLVGGRVEDARNHVESCPACQDYLAQDDVLVAAYDRLRGTRAPRELRERVFTAIARERSGQEDSIPAPESRTGRIGTALRARARAGWAIAAVGGLALASGIVITRAKTTESDEASGAAFVEDYLRRAVGQEQIHSSDPATVRQWLTRELGLPLQPLVAAGLELEGAEICLLEGRRGAMILYRMGGTRISHYLVPREGVVPREPAVGAASGADGMVPPLVTWSTPSVEQALVGEVGSEQLLALARTGF